MRHPHSERYGRVITELTVTELRIVDAVAREGSFTAAARVLGYTQSAVSRQVAAAERVAGGSLFERGPRGVVPTARGRALLGHAEAILARLDAAQLALDGFDATLAGQLTLSAFPTAIGPLVAPALGRLAAGHPEMSVRLREAGSVAGLRRLRAGRVAAAVIARGGGLEYDLADLRTDLLARGRPRIAVAARHRFAGRESVTVDELAGEPWVVGAGGPDGPEFGVWPTLAGEPAVAQVVRDWAGRLGLVAAGLGIATIPSLLVGTLPPGVRTVLVEEPRPVWRETLVATLPDRATTVQALCEALRAAGEATQASASASAAGSPTGARQVNPSHT